MVKGIVKYFVLFFSILVVLLFSSCSMENFKDFPNNLFPKHDEETSADSTTEEITYEEETLYIRRFIPEVKETTQPVTTTEQESTTKTEETETVQEEEPTTIVEYSEDDDEVTRLAKEVINGKWGHGDVRKQKLRESGYNYNQIQNKVNQMLGYEELLLD